MDAIEEAERQVIDAAVLWGIDRDCKSALAALGEAVEELMTLRRERRRQRQAAA